MAMDPVKKALADLVHEAAKQAATKLVTTEGVTQTDVQDVTPLQTQIRVRVNGSHTRYFTVQLIENI